jgi:hypothetical protein
MSGKHDRHGQHRYGYLHRKERQRWALLVRGGGVTCWRCGGPINPVSGWDLGHVDEEGRRAGLPVRHPEHIGCNRADLTHAKAKVDRFEGLPDPDPENGAERWSRHRYGGFNPRCPECWRLRGPCPAAEPGPRGGVGARPGGGRAGVQDALCQPLERVVPQW